MNLLAKLLASAKVGEGLDFGILENVILKDITNEVQMRDDQVVERNCHMRFQRLNDKGKVYQESNFSFFNIDPDREKDPYQKFLTQLTQMMEIANAIDPKCEEEFATKSFDILIDEENIKKQTKGKKPAKFQNEVADVFADVVKPYLENQPKLRLKVVTSWDGKYMNLPNTSPMIESMDIPVKDTALKLTHIEIQNYHKGLTASSSADGEATPESNGQAPKANAVLADL